MYRIACISSRAAKKDAILRMDILFARLNKIALDHGTSFEILVTGNTHLEKDVLLLTKTYKALKSYVSVDIKRNNPGIISIIKSIHPYPHKLSKIALLDLVAVYEIVNKCTFLIAAPFDPKRGRATLALRMASFRLKPSLDLYSERAPGTLALGD